MKKLCLLRLSAIGDVCHAVTLVNRIRSYWPDTELTWIIGKIEYQLVQHLSGVRFIIFDKSRGKAAYEELKATLKGERFDALLMMQVALRANLISRAVRADKRIGFDWQRSKELHWLFTNNRIDPQTHAHVLDGFMAFGDALGLPRPQAPDWQIPIPEEATRWAKSERNQLGKFAIISPAASKAERNWLPERYAQVADALNQRGIKTVLCGGPADMDRALAAKIQRHTDHISADYVGQTSLAQLMALIGEADLVIAPDTGPAHMATSINTPVIGLYAHSNPRRTGPYRDQHRVVSVYDEVIKEQRGKPWTELPWGARAKGENLMTRISVKAVEARIDDWLAEQDG
ncbi:Putative glycosyltransferase [Saliniradius amylolyticus]|uniref:Glycosyltransferase n=1 Tax=Saliniradius amylolyticus TaxID=2183582 RepID=A0A2S2DYV8_9ALTE|nr:glycosyltransferase family 9 protein [Saliniradius amylolyticus]AWL10556.1 Putative glycosyltransferase [Saliniradius amylolyticus]